MFDDGIFLMMPIFHIAEPEAWSARTEVYATAGFESDGFIHCSTEKQLAGVVEAFYEGRDDLVLLTIDPTALEGMLVYEDLDDIGEKFPHVYGPIPVAAIAAYRNFAASSIELDIEQMFDNVSNARSVFRMSSNK